MNMIDIDKSLCDGCKLCLAACHHGALVLENGKVAALASADCQDCCICEIICQRGAIIWSYEVALAGIEAKS
jgi:NAD-dependent dihydropyrimidine dehydrogenase PreA subunit